MKVTFVGTGYVGLVTGNCFAEVGNEVICVDIDEKKVEGLRNGVLPIFEPGLDKLVASNVEAGRLSFTTDLAGALATTDVVFVAVGTPQSADGSANLNYVWSVIDAIREHATSKKVVVIKSTVPVGTNRRAFQRLNDGAEIQHAVASNPEFLREGLAIGDALNPDRVVVGTQDAFARQQLSELYRPFSDKGVPVLFMHWESAEMTKYVANCVLATKISYINEMANMCEAVGADVNDVRQGIGHDQRIGFKFFYPGVGYGGSCFPKDVRAMKAMAREKKMPMRILEAVDYVNEEQKRVAFVKLQTAFNDQLHGVTIGIWGLAFKPETDDIREAPALVLIKQLLEAGANVRAYDAEASDNVKEEFGDQVTFCDEKYDVADNADALAIMTEWDEFASADFDRLRETMRGHVIVDGRNMFDPSIVAEAGFVYSSIGRSTAYPSLSVDPADEAVTTV